MERLFAIKASIMVLGNISGSFGGALQSGKLGRRCSIMIDSIIHLFAIFMLAFAPNFAMVLVARFLQGHSVGSGRVAITIYTGEICQPEIRKYTGSFAMIFILSGFLLAAILGKTKKRHIHANRTLDFYQTVRFLGCVFVKFFVEKEHYMPIKCFLVF